MSVQPIYHPGSPDETDEAWAEQWAERHDTPALRAQLADVLFDAIEIPSDWSLDVTTRLRRGVAARLFDGLGGFEVVQLAAEYDLVMSYAAWCTRDEGDL